MESADYPLEAARTLRGIAVIEAEATLAAAVAALGLAEGVVNTAAAAFRADASRAATEEDERRSREEAPSSADELLRARRYRERRRQEGRVLEEKLREARAERDQAEAGAAAARRALAQVSADQEVLERHRGAFVKKERELREAREEDEAEDIAAARRHREGG